MECRLRKGDETATLPRVVAARQMDLAGALRRLREERGPNGAPLTQKEAGRLVGVPARTIQRWEAGESFPQRRHLEALERELGLQVEDVELPERSPTIAQISAIEEKVDRVLRLLELVVEPQVPDLPPELRPRSPQARPPRTPGRHEPKT